MMCRKLNKFYLLLFRVLVLCMLLLTGCGMPDKALVLKVEESAEAVSQDDLQDAVQGMEGSAVEADGLQQSDVDNSAGQVKEQTILVYVCGAVANPGVVELPVDSRAADALEAAGGLLAEAQPDYVNLAAKLEDAQKLYFPTKEEAISLPGEETAEANGLVNINTAGVEQLCTLPGIGEARAEAIIAYREQQGVFQSKEDIMKVSGIKQSAYDKIKEQITIN